MTLLPLLTLVWMLGAWMMIFLMQLAGVPFNSLMPYVITTLIWPFALAYGILYVLFTHPRDV